MRRKGLVYRATTLLGLSIIFLQFGGEVMYAKYFRTERDDELEKVRISDKKLYRLKNKKKEKVNLKKKMTPQTVKFKRKLG